MKKLLVITNSISITEGRGRYSVEMIKKLSKDFKIIIFTSERPKDHENELNDIDLEIHDLPQVNKLTNPLIYLWLSFKLLFYALKADLIHSFADSPYCLLLIWIVFLKKPKFITVHGTYGVFPLDNPKTKILLKLIYRKVQKIFCVSTFTEKQILKRVALKNTLVINNGIDYERFQKPISIENNEGKIVLSVGAFKRRKGYHVSIPAMAEVKKEYPDIKYYIVGGRPPKTYLDLIEKHQLEKNVKFFENIPDEKLIKLYYHADVFLLTPVIVNDNNFEGFGLVYLEAGACGKPVIGTFGCGAEDAIVSGVTGLLVPQENIKKTAEAVLKLLDNPELALKMGENGRKKAQQMNWNNITKKYLETYESFKNKI